MRCLCTNQKAIKPTNESRQMYLFKLKSVLKIIKPIIILSSASFYTKKSYEHELPHQFKKGPMGKFNYQKTATLHETRPHTCNNCGRSFAKSGLSG